MNSFKYCSVVQPCLIVLMENRQFHSMPNVTRYMTVMIVQMSPLTQKVQGVQVSFAKPNHRAPTYQKSSYYTPDLL